MVTGKYHKIIKVLVVLGFLVLAVIYVAKIIQKKSEVSMCGFEIAAGESSVTITSGTVANSGGVRIGASAGSDKTFNLVFIDGTKESKFTVKECDAFEYGTARGAMRIRVSEIHPDTNWWSLAPGRGNASVVLIISE